MEAVRSFQLTLRFRFNYGFPIEKKFNELQKLQLQIASKSYMKSFLNEDKI